MPLWIGNGAVLKKFQSMEIKRILKIKYFRPWKLIIVRLTTPGIEPIISSFQVERSNQLGFAGWCCLIFYFDYFRLFVVATGCPSERRPQKTVSCYGG